MNADTQGVERTRLARAYLMAAHDAGDVEMAERVAEHGPVLAAELAAGAGRPDWDHAVAAYLTSVGERGMRLVVPEDVEWSARLSVPLPTDGRMTETAPPLGLRVRGSAQLDRLLSRTVTVAGTAEATPYGQKLAYSLGRELATAGWTVITSGSSGVSAGVIRGALACRGPVLVLPPTPLTVTVPAGHRRLFDKVAWDGLLLTESVPGRPARHGDVIRQAQLAAGLGAAVVLIEPRPRGIDRRLVHLAQDAGRPVLAFPGSTQLPGSAYAHHLIRSERARLVASPQQVLIDLEGRLSVTAREPG